MCRQRRSSSVSAMLTARKMLFSDPNPSSAPAISNVFEEAEDGETEEGDEEGTEEGTEEAPSVPHTPQESPEAGDPARRRKQKKKERRKKRFEQIMFG
jgi:hypothetical protein